nr:hypothetical protein [Tanacetum cinerariifolium]
MDTQPTCEQQIVSKPCDSALGNGEKDVYTLNTSNANATDTAYLCSDDVITELGINDDPTRCTSSDNVNNIYGCSMPVPPNTRTTTPSKRMSTKKTPPEQIISPVNRHGYVIMGIPSCVTTYLGA